MRNVTLMVLLLLVIGMSPATARDRKDDGARQKSESFKSSSRESSPKREERPKAAPRHESLAGWDMRRIKEASEARKSPDKPRPESRRDTWSVQPRSDNSPRVEPRRDEGTRRPEPRREESYRSPEPRREENTRRPEPKRESWFDRDSRVLNREENRNREYPIPRRQSWDYDRSGRGVYRSHSFNTTESILAAIVVATILSNQNSHDSAIGIAKHNGTYFSSRDECLLNFQTKYASLYINDFASIPMDRPSWIPRETRCDSVRVEVEFSREFTSYGFYDPTDPSYWVSYDLWTDVPMTNKVMAANYYLYR